MQRGVDRFVEAPAAFLATVALYTQAIPVLAERMAAAAGAAETGIVGGRRY